VKDEWARERDRGFHCKFAAFLVGPSPAILLNFRIWVEGVFTDWIPISVSEVSIPYYSHIEVLLTRRAVRPPRRAGNLLGLFSILSHTLSRQLARV
jgi:hypothetical protein